MRNKKGNDWLLAPVQVPLRGFKQEMRGNGGKKMIEPHPDGSAAGNRQTSSGRYCPPSSRDNTGASIPDNPATLLSRRIRQKQLELQALREQADKSPSRFSEEIKPELSSTKTPPPGRKLMIPPRAEDDRERAWSPRPSCIDLKGESKVLRRHGSAPGRPQADPKPLGRAFTSDFDGERFRALQLEWASSRATSDEALEIETKARRLDDLPSLKASPEAARALSALARRNLDPQPFSLRRHFTFEEQAARNPAVLRNAGNDDVSTKESTESIGDNNKYCASSFDYPRTPRCGIFLYLLILVVAMGLCVSPDPLGDLLQGHLLLRSLICGSVQVARMAHQHSIPWIRVATLQCQCALLETYMLCTHIWMAFRLAFGEIERLPLDKYILLWRAGRVEQSAVNERMTLFDSDSSSFRDVFSRTVNDQSQTSKSRIAANTLKLTFEDKRFMKEKATALRLYEGVPVDDDRYYYYSTNSTSLGPEISSQFYDLWLTPIWLSLVDLTSRHVDTTSLPSENQPMSEEECFRCWGDITDILLSKNSGASVSVFDLTDVGLSERLKLLNASKLNLNWIRSGLNVLDTKENEAVEEFLDGSIDSSSVHVGPWLRTLRNDHVQGIGGLLRGANWITLGVA